MIRRIDRNRRNYRTYRETVNVQREKDYKIINKVREYMDDKWVLEFILEELTDGALSRVASAFQRWFDDSEEIEETDRD